MLLKVRGVVLVVSSARKVRSGSTITGSKKICDGVELRYHSRENFTALDPDTMAELGEHRQTLRDKGENGGHLPVLDKDRKKRPRTVLVATGNVNSFASIAGAPMTATHQRT